MAFYRSNPVDGETNYTTVEQDTGIKWIDGSKIYKRTWELPSVKGVGAAWTEISQISGSNMKYIVKSFVISESGTTGLVMATTSLSSTGSTNVHLRAPFEGTVVKFITLYYIKK